MVELKNKEDLIKFVKHQTNVELINDPNNSLNKNNNILYTVVNVRDSYAVFPILYKYGIKYAEHLPGKYFIYVSVGPRQSKGRPRSRS